MRLQQCIHCLTEHAVLCGVSITFLGESSRHGLASVLISQCSKCHSIFRCDTSTMMTYNDESHYTINPQAVLATGGGAEHLEEQLTCLQVPSVTKATFIHLERYLGAAFEQLVSDSLLAAGREEKELAIANGYYHEEVPAITVVVDGGRSKRSHKHSYNAKSGFGVIFGASTKMLLFIGVRNKYCSVCAISERKPHHLHLTSVIGIGMALRVPWRQTLLLKVFNYQSRCMDLDTYGSLEMVTAMYTMQ